ncbi:hypothetical protein AB6A23_16420 [Paenibacillus tarimensis]
MPKRDKTAGEEPKPKFKSEFSEINELGHERNEAAKAQKQMASQETAGLMDQQ